MECPLFLNFAVYETHKLVYEMPIASILHFIYNEIRKRFHVKSRQLFSFKKILLIE
jgi:hypothetical protein